MMRRLVYSIAISLLLFACAGIFGKPSENVVFTLESVDVDSDLLTEGANIVGSIIDILTGRASQRKTDMPFTITVRVKNNNAFAIEINRITYNLRVQEYDFGRGEYLFTGSTMRVEPGYDRIIRLPLNVPYNKVIERVVKGIYRQEVNVTLMGEANAVYSGGDFVVSYATERSRVKLLR